MTTLDTSNDLQVYRFHNGIKLRNPIGSNNTVASILKLPLAIYFENRDGVTQRANAINAEMCCGFDSPEQAIGKKYFTYIKKKDVKVLRHNDSIIIEQNRNVIFEEIMTQNNGLISSTLSIRLPWYDNYNKIIGLFGCSILLGKNPLAESLHHISNLGLLAPNENINNFIGQEVHRVYLSKRQIDCAKQLLQGKKIKEIGTNLNLSPRTVENYLDNIKDKLKCQNRTDLIIKLLEYMKNSSQNTFC